MQNVLSPFYPLPPPQRSLSDTFHEVSMWTYQRPIQWRERMPPSRHVAVTPPRTSLIETLNDLDNNLIKDSFFKWMLLGCSSCAGGPADLESGTLRPKCHSSNCFQLRADHMEEIEKLLGPELSVNWNMDNPYMILIMEAINLILRSWCFSSCQHHYRLFIRSSFKYCNVLTVEPQSRLFQVEHGTDYVH